MGILKRGGVEMQELKRCLRCGYMEATVEHSVFCRMKRIGVSEFEYLDRMHQRTEDERRRTDESGGWFGSIVGSASRLL